MCYVFPLGTPTNPVAPLTVGNRVVSPYGVAGNGLQPHVEPYVPMTDAEREQWRKELARLDARKYRPITGV